MTKTVLFVLLNNYADYQGAYLSHAIHELSDKTVEVKTLSLSKFPLKSFGGITIFPDFNPDTMPRDYLGIVLIGSPSWRDKASELVFPIIEHALRNSRIIASIGSGSEFLAAHGFFNSIHHTADGIENIMLWNNSIYANRDGYCEKQSVRDGNFVSANSSGALEFARDSLRALNIVDNQRLSDWYAFHKLGFIECNRQDLFNPSTSTIG